MTAKCFMFLLAFAVSLLVWNIGAQAAGPSFVYDSLGRLVTVYDASGNAAVYKYDAVGNLLSITNSSSTTFAALELSSSSGITGSTVTIYGTGFCSNPTVTFNGMAATVVSAAATQIVVTVPINATTGSVIVTCGSNQTNAGTFTVGSATPSITGFTPTIGVGGTAVTISGANFQATPANNAIRFAGLPSPATSSTSTTINVAAPPNTVATGHISVTTPYGQATSSGYFFVPPPGVSQSSISITNPIVIGGPSVTASLNSGYNALYAFDGTAGQQISLKITSDSFGGCAGPDAPVHVSIFNPDGSSKLVNNGGVCNPGGIFSDLILPQSGTYVILISPVGTAQGAMTLQLYATPNLTNTIAIGGWAVTVSNLAPTGVPGQDMALTFSGTAGQQISLNITSDTFGGCAGPDAPVYVSIFNPDGSKLLNNGVCNPGGIIPDITLPQTGTYLIFIDPVCAVQGTMTLQLYATPDLTSTIAIGGLAVTVSNAAPTGVPGQDIALTFSGTAGQQISLNITSDSFGSCYGPLAPVYVSISTLSGTSVVNNGGVCNPGGIFSDLTLPQTGTYLIFIDPAGTAQGAMTLQLYATPDLTNTIAIGGSPVTVSNSAPGVPGQDMALTFSGTSGQQINLYISNSTFGSCYGPYAPVYVSISNPDGSQLLAANNGGVCSPGGMFPTFTLQQTGTYRIFIDPVGTAQGAMTLQLWNESDLSSTVSVTDTYARAVLGDAVQNYWRLDETSPATAANAVPSIRDGVLGPTVPDTTVTLNGASYVSTANLVAPPGSFTLEAWLKTTSISGGTLVGFNSSQTGNPAYWDRALYLSNSGNLVFGVWNGSGITSVSSPSTYNDGSWHYVAATFTNGGQLTLYVDGTSVASSAGSTTDNSGWSGYWHIGWTTYASNWPSVPTNYYFQGSLSEVAIWNSSALTPTQIANHYGASKGGSYDTTVLGDAPSSYWKLNESSGGSFADATVNANVGTARNIALNATYLGGVTLGVPGVNTGHYAVTLDGSTGYLGTGVPSGPPGTFTLEAWFKTSTTQGGTLIGFNDSPVNSPSKWDRALYLSSSGNLVFGVWNGSGITSVSSPSTYNNGSWHYVAATFTNGGQLSLYVDGTSVASSTGSTTDNSGWSGYWHIGWTTYASNWPSIPSSYYFGGTIDEPAVYPYALSSAQVSNHYLSR